MTLYIKVSSFISRIKKKSSYEKLLTYSNTNKAQKIFKKNSTNLDVNWLNENYISTFLYDYLRIYFVQFSK